MKVLLQIIGRFLLSRHRKKLFLSILLVVVFVYGSSGWKLIEWLFEVPHILTADEIGLSRCPACFGIDSSLCTSILDGEITVNVNGFWTNEYTKGVMYGRWRDKDVVVKYLASSKEIMEFERNICKSAGMNPSCDLKLNAWSSFLNNESAVQNKMDCPSDRLIKKIIDSYGKGKKSLSGEKLYLNTGLHINQEVILLKIFQKKTGWPFPKFYGSCGRVIVVENGGKNLQSFQNQPWPVRAKVALKLLELVHKLSTGELDNWVFYLGDASAENFGVNVKNEVMLLDLEHILVVDSSQMTKKMTGPTCIDYCSSNDPECLLYSPSALCHGSCRDHNLYALCRGVLADKVGCTGLLHSAPIEKELKIKLNILLEDCVSGQNGRRENIISEIVKILEKGIANYSFNKVIT